MSRSACTASQSSAVSQLLNGLQVAGSQVPHALVSASAAMASVLVGLTTATILFCSHFHQMAGDKAAGKKSPIVRLGSTKRGLQVTIVPPRNPFSSICLVICAAESSKELTPDLW